MKNEQNNKSTIQIVSKSVCCGCAACEAICPVKAIAMILDERGFYYPWIDSKKCIDCGKCLKVCNFVEK